MPTYFIHFRDLVVRLRRALAEGREESTIKNLNRYRLLVIDEVGYFPVDKAVAGLIFQLVAMRYEKKSIIVTTNQPLSKWGEVFADPVIASAIVDRLVHHSTIIRITGVSYRIKGKLDEAGEGPAADPLGGPHRKRGRPRKAASPLGPAWAPEEGGFPVGASIAWRPACSTDQKRHIVIDFYKLAWMALAIRLSGLDFRTGQARPNFRMRQEIFFLFVATPSSRGIISAIRRLPFG